MGRRLTDEELTALEVRRSCAGRSDPCPAIGDLNAVSSLLGSHVTVRQLTTLVALACANGPMQLRDVARQLQVSKPSAFRCLQGLTEAGLAVRTEPGRDRREAPVEITQRGRELIQNLARSLSVLGGPGDVRRTGPRAADATTPARTDRLGAGRSSRTIRAALKATQERHLRMFRDDSAATPDIAKATVVVLSPARTADPHGCEVELYSFGPDEPWCQSREGIETLMKARSGADESWQVFVRFDASLAGHAPHLAAANDDTAAEWPIGISALPLSHTGLPVSLSGSDRQDPPRILDRAKQEIGRALGVDQESVRLEMRIEL